MLSLWLVFSSVVILSVATSVEDCPSNLPRDKYLQALNGNCFYFHMHGLAYNDAKGFCNYIGGMLALVKTPALQTFLYDHLNNTYGYRGQVYIGLSDSIEEGKYFWEDGTPLGEWQNWAPGSGSAGLMSFMRDCVTMDTTQNGSWVDEKCKGSWIYDADKPFVCQFRVTNEGKWTSITSTQKSTTPKSATQKPMSHQTTTLKITTPKQTTQNQATIKPIAQNPTTQKGKTQKATSQRPTTQKPPTEKPGTLLLTTLKPTSLIPEPTSRQGLVKKQTDRIRISPETSNPTNEKTTAKPTCPPFECDLDCGMKGFTADQLTGCALCECD